ncbi:MAG: nitroreductase [Caulobacteraceae bacterium]|nr:nitroreductase [Caulobacteraceae bacterium]
MDTIEALFTRASPPLLTAPGPTAGQLDTILKAGSRAPDHGRMQPFRFAIMEGAARQRLGDLMAESLYRREPEASASKLDAERAKTQRAPLIIAVAAVLQPNPKVPEVEQIVCAGAAAQNMLLAAHAMGLGAFWRTGPASYDPAVKTGLGFSEADAIVGFLYFGTATVTPPERPVDVAAVTRRI